MEKINDTLKKLSMRTNFKQRYEEERNEILKMKMFANFYWKMKGELQVQ